MPEQYDSALNMAAEEMGVSPADLKGASQEELLKLLCAEIKDTSSDDLVARVHKALRSASSDELGGLSEEEVSQLEAQLPMLIAQLKTACADEAGPVTETSDEDDDDDADDAVTPTPTNIETGAGGLTDTSGSVPLAFGAVFALLFGAFGTAVVRMRHTA